MKNINQLKNIPRNFLFMTLLTMGTKVIAYPSASIIDTIPGTYSGHQFHDKLPCRVVIRNINEKMQITLVDEQTPENLIALKPISRVNLKKTYKENFEFRKKQDPSFSPESANPWLIFQIPHGTPSFFGLYPRVERLELDWYQGKLFSAHISDTYSNGGPYNLPTDNRNKEITCRNLVKN